MIVDDDPKVRVLVDALRKICAKLPGAEEYVMVHHPAFRVGKKPFAIAGLDSEQRGSALSINLGRDAQDGLLGDARFTRTPYIGQHGWVTISQRELTPGELGVLVTESWRRVANKKQLAALDGSSKAAPAMLKRARRHD
jgi:hypothetical protein